MRELAFQRVGKTRISVALIGPYRLQIWDELRDTYGPQLRFGTAMFKRTPLGWRRVATEQFFDTREAAIQRLALLAEAMNV